MRAAVCFDDRMALTSGDDQMARRSAAGTVEVVFYSARPGVSDDQILEASAALQRDVEQCSGYIDRWLLKHDEGQWLDIVDWSSLDEALSAADVIMERPAAQEFMSLIEPESIRVMHFALREVYGPAPLMA
jgi:hypothetical protein